MRVGVDFPGRTVWAKIWRARVGNNSLYLLDTQLEENSEADRKIAHQLYGGDRRTRIEQEILLGVGGVRALAALGLKPTVWHVNEGHAAFLILERIRSLVSGGLPYAAAVEALANRKVDLAWFGGFTFVQAQIRSGGKAVPIVQREEDEKFRSVFITSDPAIKQLSDLKGKDVSFGSQSSTSGHLMPRSFLLQAGVDPDKDFRRVAYSGAHDATIAAVIAALTVGAEAIGKALNWIRGK